VLYLKHFGLKKLPFTISPDTRFYFASNRHQEALNSLLFAINSSEGFIKITGEVGTGKTLLCRKFIASLDSSYKVAYISNPYLEPQSLLMAVAEKLDRYLPDEIDQHVLLKSISLGLVDAARDGLKVVLCLDEVQAMPIETLEALRLLSNLETEKRKLLQVVIFGQSELDEKLNHVFIRQLKQRISFSYQLGQLNNDEMQDYLNHRLIIAGYYGLPMFSRAALYYMYIKSGGVGVARLVNILAHKALLVTYGKGLYQVGLKQMMAAAADTESVASNFRLMARIACKEHFLLVVIPALLTSALFIYLTIT
jgi:MSHA biogenesis protein MshM